MNQSSASSLSSAQRNPDAISQRAYELWEQEGRPEGCDLRHWLAAERELNGESSTSGESNRSNGRDDSAGTSAEPSRHSDASPLQGTRAAAAANREPKRNSAAAPAEKSAGGRRK